MCFTCPTHQLNPTSFELSIIKKERYHYVISTLSSICFLQKDQRNSTAKERKQTFILGVDKQSFPLPRRKYVARMKKIHKSRVASIPGVLRKRNHASSRKQCGVMRFMTESLISVLIKNVSPQPNYQTVDFFLFTQQRFTHQFQLSTYSKHSRERLSGQTPAILYESH